MDKNLLVELLAPGLRELGFKQGVVISYADIYSMINTYDFDEYSDTYGFLKTVSDKIKTLSIVRSNIF